MKENEYEESVYSSENDFELDSKQEGYKKKQTGQKKEAFDPFKIYNKKEDSKLDYSDDQINIINNRDDSNILGNSIIGDDAHGANSFINK